MIPNVHKMNNVNKTYKTEC